MNKQANPGLAAGLLRAAKTIGGGAKAVGRGSLYTAKHPVIGPAAAALPMTYAEFEGYNPLASRLDERDSSMGEKGLAALSNFISLAGLRNTGNRAIRAWLGKGKAGWGTQFAAGASLFGTAASTPGIMYGKDLGGHLMELGDASAASARNVARLGVQMDSFMSGKAYRTTFPDGSVEIIKAPVSVAGISQGLENSKKRWQSFMDGQARSITLEDGTEELIEPGYAFNDGLKAVGDAAQVLKYVPHIAGATGGYLLGGRVSDMFQSKDDAQRNRRKAVGQAMGLTAGLAGAHFIPQLIEQHATNKG